MLGWTPIVPHSSVDLAARGVVLHVFIDALKQMTVTTPRINHKLRLLVEVVVGKNLMDVLQQILGAEG